jgi:predicted  nucleic acid-binding Zn-ribbon protein
MTKETAVENRLKLLYSLQLVDLELQEIEELKGDLPHIVRDLQSRYDEMKAKFDALNAAIKDSKLVRERADNEIVDIAEKVEKYKSQQMSVKSNRQYDALTREIENAEQRSIQLQRGMEEAENRLATSKTDADALKEQLEVLGEELKERQKELKEVNKEHEKSELALQHRRDKLVVKLGEDDLERYDRIYKAKGGTAVVPVKRNACGGCFSRVPPQKILELRRNSQIYLCEQCGRILVSDSLVVQANPAE